MSYPAGYAADLRPMGIGEILDRSFRLYRARFGTYFGITLITGMITFAWQVLWLLLVGGAAEFVPGGGAEIVAVAGILLGFLVGLIAGVLATGMLTLAISEDFLGRRLTVGDAMRRALPLVVTLTLTGILVGLATGLGYLLCIIPGIILYFGFFLSAVVAALEGSGPVASMRRSWDLMRNKTEKGFWSFRSNSSKAAIILLVMFAAGIAVGMVGGGLVLAVHMLFAAAQEPAPAFLQIAMQGFSAAANALLAPLYIIPVVLLYYDIRMRFEGLDLVMLANSMGAAPAGPDPQPQQFPPQPM